MRKITIAVLALAVLLSAAVSGFAKDSKSKMPGGVKMQKTSLGDVLANSKGMTLYTFDKDSGGKSACNGPCAQNWPPLAAAEGKAKGDWSVVTRDDGSKQWAYKGKPLYTFLKDAKAGDTTGDGFLNGAWHAAKP